MTRENIINITISEPSQICIIVRQANKFIASKPYLGVHTIGASANGVISYPVGNIEGSYLKPTVKPVTISPPFRISLSQDTNIVVSFQAKGEFSPEPSQDWMLDRLKNQFTSVIADSHPKLRQST
ncbi:MAG: hypothetical protein WAV41_01210 [Microgenomates group bacterium]